MQTSKSIVKEKNKFSKNLEIKSNLENTLNFERSTPLNPALTYVVIPQKNFSAVYNINGQDVVSPRLWLVGVDENEELKEIRSVGVNTLTAMALGLVDYSKEPQPIEAVFNHDSGKWRVVPGHRYIHAMDSTEFVKAENKRAVVKKAVFLRNTGTPSVYTIKFNDDKTISTTDGENGKKYVNTQIAGMKMFETLSQVPSDELVQKCIAQVKKDCGANFYSL